MRTNIIQDERLAADYYMANGWTVVEVVGEVDVYTSPMVREAVIKLLDEGRHHFVLDLHRVPLLDSMGLGTIVAITKRIRAEEGSLRIVCIDERIFKVFKIGGLRTAYSFHNTVDEATRQLPPRHGSLAGWPGD